MQLLDQGQQLRSSFSFKDGPRDIHNICLENFDQGEVLHPKLGLPFQGQAAADFFGKANIGGQQLNADGPGVEGQSGRKNHFSTTTPHIQEGLAWLQPGLLKNLQSRKVRRFAKAKIAKRSLAQRSTLQPDIQGQKTKKIVNPQQQLYLPQIRNPEKRLGFPGS
ncbi:hypothetical protein IV102_20170 [bacterium]|nr:hypothetical protein [bacterium]